MYTFYSFPISQHARRVLALLTEAEIPFELKHVAMDQGEFMTPEYMAINPNHQVPTLVEGDLKIHESNAILRFLCNKHSLTNWYPASANERAKVDQWLDWNQCLLGVATTSIVFNKVFAGENGDQEAIKRGEEKMAELGKDIESRVLARAVRAHAEGRVFLNDKRTVVFE